MRSISTLVRTEPNRSFPTMNSRISLSSRPVVSIYFVLSICIVLSITDGYVLRVKRQDWNFPGMVDNSDLTSDRRPTLPPVGITVFREPCGRCLTTNQYNPVCGDDNRTYANPALLDCARTCGFRVTVQYMGVCETPR